jgi:jumonji domain-containing protein 7
VTALHKDNYENIYCQLVGQKHFVLLPPLSCPCIGEQDLAPASYARRNGRLEVVQEINAQAVPFPTWDPDCPEQRSTEYSHLARPLRATLNAGDILYLPAMWYVNLD